MIYFDNAASTPIEPEVIELINKTMKEYFGNPSSPHEYGRRSKVLIENSRKSIANLVGVSSSEIIFTSGGTEANNHILWSCILDLKRYHFITSPIEHPSVLNTLDNISRHFDIKVTHVAIDSKGHIDTDHLDNILKTSPPSVVCLMHANSEIGNLLPVKKVNKICKNHNAIFFSDTVQSIGKFNINLNDSGFDLAIGSAHKFHGLKSTGFIYLSPDSKLKPLITGGAQENNMRAGTENVYGIAGMSKALEIAMRDVEKNQNHISQLKQKLIEMIKEELPEIEFNGDVNVKGIHTIINLRLPASEKSEMLLANLDIEGFAVTSGSACSSGSNKPSRVITSLGVPPEKPSLRISFSKYNKPGEIEKFVETLKQIYF